MYVQKFLSDATFERQFVTTCELPKISTVTDTRKTRILAENTDFL